MPLKEKKKMSTPNTPLLKLIKVKEGEVVLSLEEQKLYRSGMAILLYLVKHTRSDLANTTSEPLKATDVANYLHWKELLCVVTFALHTQERESF